MSDICTVCYAVDIDSDWLKGCFAGGSHNIVEAVVVECPYLVRTSTGRVTKRCRDQANEDCLGAIEVIGAGHHYGDSERRHFMTPDDVERFTEGLAQTHRIAELEAELKEIHAVLAVLKGSPNE